MNFRPISNLALLGKLIERVVLIRLNKHILSNNLDVPFQSGYKKSHSTETLLIRVLNDILIASSENKATVVMMLDLSVAFDTVDHNKLLMILQHELGIQGIALKWFKSYLCGRCQRIRVGDEVSEEIIIKYGVPQGSVLGPVLFNIYVRSLYSTVKQLKFAIHGYADDHQIYRSFKKIDEYAIMTNEIPNCFQQVSFWMIRHFLQINPGKTVVIVFGSPSLLYQLHIKGVFLNADVCIRLSPVVKSLGFHIDAELTFKYQVNKLKSKLLHKLRKIGRMRVFLTNEQIKILVQSSILLSIDYCNSLYYNCTKSVINQLQMIQNHACRVIFGLKRKELVEEKLKSLHWLKVQQRIEFKIILLMFKCIHSAAPLYLKELFYNNDFGEMRTLSLHSSGVTALNEKAFQFAGIKLWNSLPNAIKGLTDINVFKKKVKTYLFNQSYNIDNMS